MKCIQCVALAALWATLAPVAALVLDAKAPSDAAPLEVRPHSSIATRDVQQEIEQMAVRADRLAKSDKVAAEAVVSGLEDVEAALEARAGGDTALAEEIRATRGALCARQGFHSHERADCEVFMRRACLPNEEQLPGRPQQTTRPLPAETCRQFFIDVTADSSARSGSGPALAPAADTPQDPAAAPVKDWFSKEIQSLPEQGVSGDERIEHEDGASQTDDWQREFGPKAEHRSYRTICRDHPDNDWCRLHMKYEGSGLPSGWSRSASRSGSRPSSQEELSSGEKAIARQEDGAPKENGAPAELEAENARRRQAEEEEEGPPGGARSGKGVLAGTAILLAVIAQLSA